MVERYHGTLIEGAGADIARALTPLKPTRNRSRRAFRPLLGHGWKQAGRCPTRGKTPCAGQTSSTPGRTRTCDLLLRRQLLYPAELRGPVGQDRRAGRRSCITPPPPRRGSAGPPSPRSGRRGRAAPRALPSSATRPPSSTAICSASSHGGQPVGDRERRPAARRAGRAPPGRRARCRRRGRWSPRRGSGPAGRAGRARAIAIRCFSPPEKR